MNVTHAMLLIKSLDNNASICVSERTREWYVNADISISDGVVLTSSTEYRSNPHEAVMDFLASLTSLPHDSVLVSHNAGKRRHHRWNGAAFAEVPEWGP